MESSSMTSMKGGRRNSFLLSDHHSPLKELYPPLTETSRLDDDDDQVDLETLVLTTPVFQRTAKFEPFKLSPTVIGIADSDVGNASPMNVAASKTRRRESGLVQMMSHLEQLKVGEFTPMAAERHRLRNRLDDLISTLSYSPSHNVDDEESFLKAPIVPDF
jgi:hypothetical protein